MSQKYSARSSTPLDFAETDEFDEETIPKFVHPTDDRAFIFDCVGNYRLHDYLDTLTERSYFRPRDIVSATVIDDKRVIIYIREEDVFSLFIEGEGFLMKNGTFIKCRPLQETKTKLIITNIPPSVPNDVLLNFITNVLKLRAVSDIAILPINAKNKRFAHVVSWKREVYVDDDDNLENFLDRVPYILPFDKKIYRVRFIVRKNILCQKCMSSNHRIENCFFSPMPKIL